MSQKIKTDLLVDGTVTATSFIGSASDPTKLPLAGGTLTGDLAISNGQPKLRLKETDTTNLDKELLVSGGEFYIRNLNDDNTAGTNILIVGNSGNLTASGIITATGANLSGNLTLSYAYPRINLIDTNNDSDYSIINNDGTFSVYDITNNIHRFSIASGGDISISNNLAITGTLSASGYNKSNWDTAYGWGNHAGLYSLLGHTHDYLPIGGKAADSELLDGIDSSRVVFGANSTKSIGFDSGNINTALASGFYDGYNMVGAPTASTYYHLIHARHNNTANNFAMQLASDFYSDSLYYRQISNDVPSAWRTIIHSGNIGSQSVANASTLDSLDSSQFLRSDENDTMTGSLTVNGSGVGITATSSQNTGLIVDGGTNSGIISEFKFGTRKAYISTSGNIYSSGLFDIDDTNYYVNPSSSGLSAKFNGNLEVYARSAGWAEGVRIRVPTTNTWGGVRWTRDRANYDGNWALGFKGAGDTSDDLVFWANNAGSEGDKARLDKAGNLTVTSGVYAPIFYDSNDTTYYANPASTSNLNLLNIGNTREDFPLLSMGSSGRYALGVGSAYTRLSAHPSGNGVQFGTWDGSTFSAKLTVYNGGTSEATNDFRAPIFYDSNDTGYYANLASATSLYINGGVNQNNLVGRPHAVWGSTGTTGAVVIKFPGGTGNYGMIHAVIDIYEYSGDHGCTVIVSGHNWNEAWYSYGAQLIGRTNKQIRVGVKDGKYCIVIGDGSSVWSYGQVVLRKIQNGTYYQNVMNVGEGYTVNIESDSYSWISSDLKQFNITADIISTTSLRAPIFYDLDNTGYYVNPASTSNLNALNVGGHAVITAGNISSQSVSYAVSAGAATTSITFVSNRTNYKGYTDNAVAGQLMWKNYGNNHTIFDASAGTSPDGTTVNRHTPDYPVLVSDGNNSWGTNANLMGWNGGNTYGVKVDWSRYSETSGSTNSVAWGNISSIPSLWYQSGSWLADFASYGFIRENGVAMTGGSEFVVLSNGGRGYVLIDGSYFAGEQGGFYSLNTSNQYTSQVGFSRDSNAFAAFNTTVSAANDMRSPIFYDSNNTGYYVNPNGTSVLGFASFEGNNEGYNARTTTGVSIGKYLTEYAYIDLASANANGSWIDFSYANGTDYNGRIRYHNGNNEFKFDTDGGTRLYLNSDYLYHTSDMRSPIFYDSNDTGYYVDPNNISNLYGVAIRGDADSTATGNQIFFWSGGNTTTSAIGFKYSGGYFPNPTGAGDGYNTFLTMDTPGRGWVFREGVGGSNFGAAYTSGWILNNGVWQANASMRAPIFYDTDNTGYYLDPTNGGVALRISGAIQGDHVGWTGEHNKIQWHSSHMYFQNMNDGYWLFRRSNGSEPFQLHADGWGLATNSWRAPIFYDSNNTAYYVNPDAYSQLSYGNFNAAPNGRSLSLGGDDNSRVYDDGNRSSLVINAPYYPHLYINAMSNGSNSVHGPVFSMSGVLSGGGYRRWGMGIANTDPDCFSWGYYDNNSNPHYGVGGQFGYTGTNSKMWLNTGGSLMTSGDMRAPIYYDSNNTSYYVDPNGETVLGGPLRIDYSNAYLYVKSVHNSSGVQWHDQIWLGRYDRLQTGGAYPTYLPGAAYGVHVTQSSDSCFFGLITRGASSNDYNTVIAWADDSPEDVLQFRFNNNVVGTITPSGALTMSSDITAYSDARVKENITTIDNALDKILNLRGVYYNRTDLEYDKSKKIGVIAQEIIEVLPEVVAEDQDGMLGVSYGNITAVLIEAIKEQQKQIEELKAIVNGFTK